MANLILEHHDHIDVILLNNPEKRNPMDKGMAAEFRSLIESYKEMRPAELPRACIISGKGSAFSAGGDLKMLEEKIRQTPEINQSEMLAFYESFLSLLKLNIPLIAAVNGSAIGAGLAIACACDIRIVVRGAKLGATFSKIGIHPGMGIAHTLPRIVGYSKACELLLTGRIMKSEEWDRIGLVSELVEPGMALEHSMKIAREIATAGPLATRQIISSLRSVHLQELGTSLERDATCQALNYMSADYSEGLKAIKEKRLPDFSNT